MKRAWLYIIAPALALLGAGIYLLMLGASDAGAVEEQVLRFHVVGASDTAEDQQIKCKVRDGLFELIQQLFADCADRQEAIETAQAHQEQLQARAEELLRQEGSASSVKVEIGECFFPTKEYGALSFPAGQYQAVSIRIGKAEGENFWCVLYPALCIAPAVADEEAADEMAAILGRERVEFLQRARPTYKVRFALAEWWGRLRQKFGF